MKRVKILFKTLWLLWCLAWIVLQGRYFITCWPEERQVENELHFIFALRDFQDAAGQFPLPDNIESASGEPILSWRVKLLQNLMPNTTIQDYSHSDFNYVFNCSKPWDDAENSSSSSRLPSLFALDTIGSSKVNKSGKTRLLRIEDVHNLLKSDAFKESKRSYPYLVWVERKDAVPWTKPQDVSAQDIITRKVELYSLNSGETIYYFDSDGYFADGTFEEIRDALLELK